MRRRTGSPGRARVARRAGAGVLAAAMLVAGCSIRRAPRPTTFEDEAKKVQAATPEGRPWFCNSVGSGTPPSGHGNGSHMDPAYAGRVKAPLDWDVCTRLAGQLDQTLGAVQGLGTFAKGQAAGWVMMGPYVAGLGTHNGKFANLGVQAFDPAKPTFLIYGGQQPDSPLMGVAFRVPGDQPAPPEGYAGGNDWYHKHTKVCVMPGLGGGEELTDEACTALGGTNMTVPGGGDYLLHVWLVDPYSYRPDIFVSGHPCLLAAGVAPPGDPCWEIAHRDPSLGPPPTMPGNGDHGDGHDH